MLALLLTGCSDNRADSGDTRAPDARPQAGIVHLTTEEIQSGEIVVRSVTSGDFRVHREFPATVTPNHHATAQITALVRGRVVDVFADFGQEVKGGDVLAMLYSGELGMAQSSYLKSGARLYVTEQAFERAQTLFEKKSLLWRNSSVAKGNVERTSRTPEAQDRLRLLGMTDDQIVSLIEIKKIRSNIPITAPFGGRIIFRNLTKAKSWVTSSVYHRRSRKSGYWRTFPEKDIPFIRHSERTDEGATSVRLNAYRMKIARQGDVRRRCPRRGHGR